MDMRDRKGDCDDLISSALMTGTDRFHTLVQNNGGALSMEEAAGELSLSPAEIIRKIKQNGLLVYQLHGTEYRLPKFQFISTIQAHLPDIISAFPDKNDQESAIIFFLSEGIDGKSPAEHIISGGSISRVIFEARNYMKPGT
jgi:hypothetical protein